MKIIFEVLYKNGHVDVSEIELTEENAKDIKKVNEIIETGFNENVSGYLTLPINEKQVLKIRLDDVSRVKLTYVE
jgi:hypothetical protein